MTGKKSHQPPPPPLGLRASRVRRRELLESLQHRVADYERQGAQATLEMQQAAHAVAVENRRLRGLLAAYDVPQAEVDEYARTGVSGNVPPEGALPTPPPESPPHFGRLSKQHAPPAAVAPSYVSEEDPQCGQAKPQQTCAPLTPCSSDRSATGSASPSDVVAIPPLMGSVVDVAAVPAAGQSGGIKRKLEEACPADLGGDDTQHSGGSGGSDSKRLNREQLAVSPADTVKTCYPSVRAPAKCVIPSDAPLEKEELATIAPEPAACCGPKACGAPVTIELEPRHPSPQPLPQAVSCCSTLPSQAISYCGADADGPLQARSVF
ncbi:hypothetical protein RB600_004503 [Gaeumannomyces tritici]